MKNEKAIRRLSACAAVAASLCLLIAGTKAITQEGVQDNGTANRTADRAARIADLRATLQDQQLRSSDPERVENAIVRLGEEKVVEAVPDLIQLLTFEREMPWEKHEGGERAGELSIITPGRRYPAVTALYEIGESSLPALLEVVGREPSDSVASRNARYVLSGIFRARPAEGVEYLKNAAARAQSPDDARRLSAAAEEAERFTPKQKP